jgi:hypothetical protein
VKLEGKRIDAWLSLAKKGIVTRHIKEAKKRGSWLLKSSEDFGLGYLDAKRP